MFEDVLIATPVAHRYKYCDTCRREWPPAQDYCFACARWLGAEPKERTDWTISEPSSPHALGTTYDELSAAAICLQLTGPRPTETSLRRAAVLVRNTFVGDPPFNGVVAAAGRGWLAWTSLGMRAGFLSAIALADRLAAAAASLETQLEPGSKVRWGVWIDDYLFHCDAMGSPVVAETALDAIFDFELVSAVFVSDTIFRANRRWEKFVCVPMRRLAAAADYGYRAGGRKRPSALDHLHVPPQADFVGRFDDLAKLDTRWELCSEATQRVAILGPAGTGKTRLITEWRRRHHDVRFLSATFSIFGGDLTSFVRQLIELPETSLDTAALIEGICSRIGRDRIDVLVVDDLHWAPEGAADFLKRLLARLPNRGMMILLCTRPSGKPFLQLLPVETRLRLPPLSRGEVAALARALGLAPELAVRVESSANGNPLYAEQFAAWAGDTNYSGEGPSPQTLHDVIAARIAHLETVRLRELRRRATWSNDAWTRKSIDGELTDLETTIGLWLDRLETGDYADRPDALGYLTSLERINLEILVMRSILGQSANSRSNRIAETIERLLLGSASTVLAQLRERALVGGSAVNAHLSMEAQRAGMAAADNYRWELAEQFYEVALDVAPEGDIAALQRRRADCRRHIDSAAVHIDRTSAQATVARLNTHPAVSPAGLPEVWLQLVAATGVSAYARRAAAAADAVGDRAVAELARIAIRNVRDRE